MATTAPLPDLLGRGLYSPSEAAYYTKLRLQTVNRWMFGTKRSEPVLRPSVDADDQTLTFVDLIQLAAVREIRRNADEAVSLQKVRDAVRRAQDKHQIDFPLARPHTTFLCDGDIHIDLKDGECLVQLTGRAAGSRVSRKIIEPFMQDLAFDQEGLAKRWDVFKYGDREVRIDPTIKLGSPYLPTCNVSAETLADAYRIEGSPAAAAEAFGVDEADIILADRYLSSLDFDRAAA